MKLTTRPGDPPHPDHEDRQVNRSLQAVAPEGFARQSVSLQQMIDMSLGEEQYERE